MEKFDTVSNKADNGQAVSLFERYDVVDVRALIADFPIALVCGGPAGSLRKSLLQLIGSDDADGNLVELIGNLMLSKSLDGILSDDPARDDPVQRSGRLCIARICGQAGLNTDLELCAGHIQSEDRLRRCVDAEVPDGAAQCDGGWAASAVKRQGTGGARFRHADANCRFPGDSDARGREVQAGTGRNARNVQRDIGRASQWRDYGMDAALRRATLNTGVRALGYTAGGGMLAHDSDVDPVVVFECQSRQNLLAGYCEDVCP